MNILITGADGQLGRDLLRVLTPTNACTVYTRQELAGWNLPTSKSNAERGNSV